MVAFLDIRYYWNFHEQSSPVCKFYFYFCLSMLALCVWFIKAITYLLTNSYFLWSVLYVPKEGRIIY